MAVVKPFRALRYDEAKAGPLESLVAPPYDVISDEQRAELPRRSPHNVVHLTLPDSEEEAARTLARLAGARACSCEEPPALWVLVQDYVGPDGVARQRERARRLAAGRAVRDEDGAPARAHAPRPEGGAAAAAARDRRPARADLPALRRRAAGRGARAASPTSRSTGARLWRLDDPTLVRAFDDKQLLIADGHHRYETALAYHEEEGTEASAQMLVVLVSTRGSRARDLPDAPRLRRTRRGWRASASRWRSARPRSSELRAAAPQAPAVVEVTRDGAAVVRGEPGLLDVQLVDTLGTTASRTRRTWPRRCAACARARRRGRLPAAADADRGRLRGRAARRGAAAEDDVLLPEARLRPALPPAVSPWLEVCRDAVGGRPRRARRAADARRARARRRRGRGRRRHDRDRRGGRGGRGRAAGAARGGLHARLRGARRGDATARAARGASSSTRSTAR